MADGEAGPAEDFRSPAHHFAHQGVVGVEGLADGPGSNDPQIALEPFGQEGGAAGGHRGANLVLDSRAAGQGFQTSCIAAAAAEAAFGLHDDVSDFAGGLAGPPPELPLAHEAAADAGAHEHSEGAAGPACCPQPGLAQRAQVAVIAQGHGQVVAACQPRHDLHAGKVHIGGDDHAASFGIDHTRHRDAQRGNALGPQPLLGQKAVDQPAHSGEHFVSRSGPRGGGPQPGGNAAGLVGQGGQNLRPADIDSQIPSCLAFGHGQRLAWGQPRLVRGILGGGPASHRPRLRGHFTPAAPGTSRAA